MRTVFNLLGILMICCGTNISEAESPFLMAKTSREIGVFLNTVPKKAVVLIDIDDTIITPASKAFRAPPHNKMIDEIKKNKEDYDNYESIVSNWRLQRKAMLLDNNWPELISKLKQKFSVFGLTKMDTGEFGNIKSVEDWRYRELQALGITFSSNTKIPNCTVNDAVFYNGLFLTGKNSKSQTILSYIHYLDAETIVLIDDREEHLEDLKKFCENNAIQFIGILFSGLENLQDRPDDDVAQFQKQHLIKNAQWLEDAEAERMMAEFPAAAKS